MTDAHLKSGYERRKDLVEELVTVCMKTRLITRNTSALWPWCYLQLHVCCLVPFNFCFIALSIRIEARLFVGLEDAIKEIPASKLWLVFEIIPSTLEVFQSCRWTSQICAAEKQTNFLYSIHFPFDTDLFHWHWKWLTAELREKSKVGVEKQKNRYQTNQKKINSS